MTIAFPPESTTATALTSLPDRPPLSPKRLAANRANATKSTGPRTPAGKKTVSKSATTHHLTSADPPPLADPNYATRLYELKEEHRPSTPSQHYLVEHLAHIGWKLDQLPRLEAQAMHEASSSSDSAFCLRPSAFSPGSPLSRLWDLHRRLLAQFQSVLRQLPQLRRQQQTHYEDDAAAAERERLIDSGHKIDRYCAAMEAEPRAQNKPTEVDPPTPAHPAPQSLASSRPDDAAPAITQLPAPHGATKTHAAPQTRPPAQNEPTTPPLAFPTSAPRRLGVHPSPPAQNEPTQPTPHPTCCDAVKVSPVNTP